ncbi:hypothetical protein DID88_009498 [Monilinia fructigena]|uniref:Uncharacterized protein n=1 Tax=Monilinia fructigena TaxID=38457 RepID=A0A395IPM3_9HELO|nr:hypothetical protein DID88_009498 [Monilinia fructigena]
MAVFRKKPRNFVVRQFTMSSNTTITSTDPTTSVPSSSIVIPSTSPSSIETTPTPTIPTTPVTVATTPTTSAFTTQPTTHKPPLNPLLPRHHTHNHRIHTIVSGCIRCLRHSNGWCCIGQVTTEYITSTQAITSKSSSTSSSSSSSTATGTAGLSNAGGTNSGSKRKDAEEMRRKEVEEYGYNPNNDPTIPAVGSGEAMDPTKCGKKEGSGYRGWGTTAVASSGRKSFDNIIWRSIRRVELAWLIRKETSPTHAVSDTRSDNPLVDHHEDEAMGAMGPSAGGNRDINRGPSNASSSYSAANRSDGSGEGPGGYNGGGQYYDQYGGGNPYNDATPYGSPPNRAEVSGQPVIRDVSARRNTRIENPSHYPGQQSAGISQNF